MGKLAGAEIPPAKHASTFSHSSHVLHQVALPDAYPHMALAPGSITDRTGQIVDAMLHPLRRSEEADSTMSAKASSRASAPDAAGGKPRALSGSAEGADLR